MLNSLLTRLSHHVIEILDSLETCYAKQTHQDAIICFTEDRDTNLDDSS